MPLALGLVSYFKYEKRNNLTKIYCKVHIFIIVIKMCLLGARPLGAFWFVCLFVFLFVYTNKHQPKDAAVYIY